MGAWDVAAIERAFTDAAVDPSRWHAAMEVVTNVTESAGAALFPRPNSSIPNSLPFVPQSQSLVSAFEQYLREGWIEHDERYRACSQASRTCSPDGIATRTVFQVRNSSFRHFEPLCSECSLSRIGMLP